MKVLKKFMKPLSKVRKLESWTAYNTQGKKFKSKKTILDK